MLVESTHRLLDEYCLELQEKIFQNQPLEIFGRGRVQKTEDIYRFAAAILKIGQSINDEPSRDTFLKFLNENKIKQIYRVGAPPLNLDFTTVIETIEKGKVAPAVTLEIVSKEPAKIDEASQALNNLINETFGWSFGVNVYRSYLQSEACLCVVCRDEKSRQIVGFMYGTLVEIEGKISQKSSHEKIKVFSFWLCVKSINYPGIHFVEFLKDFEALKNEIDKFNPDYLSLAIDKKQTLPRSLYEKIGFREDTSTTSKSFLNSLVGQENSCMTMNISGTPIPFDRKAVRQALEKQGLQIVGHLSSAACIVSSVFSSSFNRIFYT